MDYFDKHGKHIGRGPAADTSYNVSLEEAKDQIKNPSIVLGESIDTFYALAFTSAGTIRGAVCRDREKALASLRAICLQTGVKCP